MSRQMHVTAGPVQVLVELLETPSADALWEALPLSAEAHTWGDEIYCQVPVSAQLEPGAVEVVQAGDVAFWPSGSALCLFFGPTPVSRPGEIRPASAVNVIGRLQGDPAVLAGVPAGIHLKIARGA